MFSSYLWLIHSHTHCARPARTHSSGLPSKYSFSWASAMNTQLTRKWMQLRPIQFVFFINLTPCLTASLFPSFFLPLYCRLAGCFHIFWSRFSNSITKTASLLILPAAWRITLTLAAPFGRHPLLHFPCVCAVEALALWPTTLVLITQTAHAVNALMCFCLT